MALTRPNAAQVNFDVTNITDPLIRLNSNQSGTNDKDIGIVFERGSDTNVAIMWDESVNQLVIVNTTETGNTSGDVTISSYADIKANAYYGDGSNLTGISSYTDSDVATYLSNNGYGTSTSIIASITDSAPSTLDTLNELAAALGDDANFSTTVTNSLATKAPLANPALTGIATVAGTVEISPGTSYDPTGGGTGTDTASDVAVAFPSGNRIVGTNDGYIRTIIEWNSSSDIQIGQNGTSLIAGIDLLPGSSGSAKVNGNRILTTADEGTGNGLDADTLDGVQGSGYAQLSSAPTFSGGALTVDNGSGKAMFGNDGGGSISLGRTDNVSSTPYIDFNSGSTTVDHDARIQGSGGSGSSAGGTLTFTCATASFSNTVTATEFDGIATSAKYADLAEKYLADAAYPVGTVLEIGGDAEVTIASPDSYKIVGTISEKPGLLMNTGLEGENVVPVAYIGRVPCRVQGTINRGDFLVVGNTPGVAVAEHPMNILMGAAIGKALENYASNDEGIIEILVGRL